jgi:SRSO17 transposase
VFAAYVSRHGHAFIDRALYLPKAWTTDRARLKAAHVPAEVGFATKPRLAVAMIERAIAAEVPFRWVRAAERNSLRKRPGSPAAAARNWSAA